MEDIDTLNSSNSVLPTTPSTLPSGVVKEPTENTHSHSQGGQQQSETLIQRLSETEGTQSRSPSENDLDQTSVNYHSNPRRYHTNNESAQVTQSRSIFSHEDSFVYGNPKEVIRTIEPPPCEMIPELRSFDNSTNVLDLSCRTSSKTENEKKDLTNQDTYQSYKRITNKNFGLQLANDPPFASGSHLEIPLLSRKPSIPEQLQIAKLQRQQRKAAQQQQKMLQQMRRNLESAGKSSSEANRNSLLVSNSDSNQGNQKNLKQFTVNDQNEIGLENHSRKKEDRLSYPTNSYLTNPHYPYYDPVPSKELPDGHPILPLFDPVYFSALYNAHGYLPPSSPSIAAAFISTLHEVLPKLPSIFSPPPNNNISPQKTHEQN